MNNHNFFYETKDLIGKTIAQHVRFKTLYISSPCYTKQQREITTTYVVCEPKPRRQIILIFIWNSTLFYTLCWSWGVAPYETVNTCSHLLKF